VYNPPGIMLANLRALFGVVVDIVLLRRGPEHLPASPGLLGIVISIYLATSAALLAMTPNHPPNWPLQLPAIIVFAMLWFQAALAVAKKPERFVQTTTAYFAATCLFLPVTLPLESALRPFMASKEAMSDAPALLVFPGLAIGIWLIIVQARIVRSAFEWRTFQSILFILALDFVGAVLLGMLFGISRPAA
jgi:hypothetical protein